MLNGTKRLFPSEYDKFKTAMIEAAENEELPISLQMNDIKDFTLNDFQDMFFEFKRDTGLDINGNMFICDECGKLHILLEVDYSEENTTLLQ